MGQDAVEPVAEGFAGRGDFSGDVALDGSNGNVTGFDGGAAPVNPGGFEPLTGSAHRLQNVLRVMFQAGRQRFFVAEDQQSFGGGLGAALVEGFCKKEGERFGLFLELSRELAKAARLVRGCCRRSQEPLDGEAEFGDAMAGGGDDRNHWHIERGVEFFGVNLMAIFFRHINHVERNECWMAQFDDLGGVVKVALQVRGIHDDND